MGGRKESSHLAPSRTLRDLREAAGRLAAPRAPVAPGGHEVPVRGRRLLPGARPVPEPLPGRRAHLEEAEVLAVLGSRLEPRFAPGDVDGVPAVLAEDSANRCSWRCGAQLAELHCSERPAEPTDLRLRAPQSMPHPHKRLQRDNAVGRPAEKLAVLVEEPERASSLPLDDELAVQPDRQRCALSVHAQRAGCSAVARFRCRSGLYEHREHAEANEYGFQTSSS